MKLSEFRHHLGLLSELHFRQPDGSEIPPHFHITEAGLMTKHFLDCGGVLRSEKAALLQVWVAEDFDHRLSPPKLAGILRQADPLFGGEDLEVEIEYDSGTLGRYGIEPGEGHFVLKPRHADCLAREQCGIPAAVPAAAACRPGGGCC